MAALENTESVSSVDGAEYFYVSNDGLETILEDKFKDLKEWLAKNKSHENEQECDLKREVQSLKSVICEKTSTSRDEISGMIQSLKNILQENVSENFMNKEINNLVSDVRNKEQELKALSIEVEVQQAGIHSLKLENAQRTQTIIDLTEENLAIEALKNEVETLKNEITMMKSNLREKDIKMLSKEFKLSEITNELAEFKKREVMRGSEIELLKFSNAELNKMNSDLKEENATLRFVISDGYK